MMLRRHFVRVLLAASAGLAAAPLALAADVPTDWWINLDNDRAARVTRDLNAGADPNLKTAAGLPSIMYAVQVGAWQVFDVLAAAPALDVEALNQDDENVLMYAALMGQKERLERLLARGAEVNRLGWTALHYAAASGHADIVRLLLERGALVNAPSPDGTSPLMMAARANSRETVQALLSAGAHLEQRNLAGHRAAEFAAENGHASLAESLRELAQRPGRPER